MPSVSFKNVTWGGNDHFWKGKLSQMAQNDQWLFENTPRVNYNAWKVNKSSGVRMISGIAVIPKSNSRTGSVAVSLGSFFSPGCKPVITIGLNNTNGKVNTNYSLKGVYPSMIPDHRGFSVMTYTKDAYAASDKITHTIYIHWTAVGY